MRLEDLDIRAAQAVTEITGKIAEVMNTAATTGNAVLQDRLVETGRDANGQPFKRYTPKYEDRKRKLGRFRDIVDFTLSGEMLRRVGIIESRFDGSRYIVRVGARDDHNREKMIGNDTNRPGFYTLSTKEQQNLAQDAANELADWAANIFLK